MPASAAPRLVLRADGSPAIGLGHLMRLLALADILRSEFAEIVFATQQPAPEIVVLLQAAGTTVLSLPALSLDEEPAWLQAHLLQSTDVLVLDGYGFDFAYQQAVRAALAHLVCLDDLHAFPSAADLVLNPAGGVSEADYDLRQFGARLLAGPKFAPLRAAFQTVPEGNTSSEAPVDTVLLCLGGADPRQLTQQVATALLALPTVVHIHAVVGSAYANWPVLAEWATSHANRLTLHRNLSASELAALMHLCGAAVCSSSTISYEYCAAGGGLLLLLPTADNQHDLDHFLRGAGLGLPYTSAPNVLTSPEASRLANQLRQAQRQHFDGLAPTRLRQEFQAVQVSAPLRLRRVVAADSAQLLAWTNEPETRRQSFDPTPVAAATHEIWFANQLTNPSALLLLAEDAATGQPAGLIRFALDADGQAATLGYSLDAGCRGQGWAAPLLLAGTHAALTHFAGLKRVRGEVRRSNEASVRAFRRAGFGVENEDKERITFVWVA